MIRQTALIICHAAIHTYITARLKESSVFNGSGSNLGQSDII
jgi:hypothetical protein